MADALELVGVAEAAAACAAASCGSRCPNGERSEAFVWRQPLMRPAGNEQQVHQGRGLPSRMAQNMSIFTLLQALQRLVAKS